MLCTSCLRVVREWARRSISATATALTEDGKIQDWHCTCGPPLRTDEGYQVSASLRISSNTIDYLQLQTSGGVSSLEVVLNIQESGRVYRERIDAIHRFGEMYEGKIESREQVEGVRNLGDLLIGREFKPGKGHGLFDWLPPKTKNQVKAVIAPLNEWQMSAFNMVARTKYPLAFVQGPPGCGKTTFVAKVIKSIMLIQENALAVAATNTAADLLALRIKKALPNELILRVFSLNEELSDLDKPNTPHRGSNITESRECPELAALLASCSP